MKRLLHLIIGHDQNRTPLGQFVLRGLPREWVLCSCGRTQLVPTVDAFFARAEAEFEAMGILPKTVS